MHGVGISRKNTKKNLQSNYEELWKYLTYSNLQGNNSNFGEFIPL